MGKTQRTEMKFVSTNNAVTVGAGVEIFSQTVIQNIDCRPWFSGVGWAMGANGIASFAGSAVGDYAYSKTSKLGRALLDSGALEVTPSKTGSIIGSITGDGVANGIPLGVDYTRQNKRGQRK